MITKKSSKIKVLVVDDDDSILDALSLILEDEGYAVKTTVKGDKTFTIVTAFQPQVILLDVLMSGNDGRHICKRLKSDEKTKHIPIYMISAHPTANIDALEGGADDFLPKPFDTAVLLEKIKKVLS